MTNNKILINQSVAILCDGNNIERSIHENSGNSSAMVNFDTLIPKLLNNRGLNRLIYFREGKNISSKLAERLHDQYYGSVVPCHKSADIPLSIKATQLASKVDTIIIMSGDSDYIDLVKHLKSEGVRVEVAAVKETTARILIEEVDHFHPITRADWFIYNSPKNNHRRMPMRRNVSPNHKTPVNAKNHVKNVVPVKKAPVSKVPEASKPIIPNNKARVEPEKKIVLPSTPVAKAPMKKKTPVIKAPVRAKVATPIKPKTVTKAPVTKTKVPVKSKTKEVKKSTTKVAKKKTTKAKTK